MLVFPLRLRHGSSSRKLTRLRRCQQCLQISHLHVKLTSQQVPVIRMDGHLSVCLFDVCCQPERDLSYLCLLAHKPLEVRCHRCTHLITKMCGSVHEVSVRSVVEHPCRGDSSRLLLPLRSEARHDQVRESDSCFRLRHDQNLTSSRLVTENFQH